MQGAQSQNVIAEVRGRERAQEVVLLGAHLDSWDQGTGAIDDGTGTAIIVAAAKLIRDLPQKPQRTVRVVLFGSEEVAQPLPPGSAFGGHAYAERHRTELASHVLTGESDFGTDRVYELALPAAVADGTFAASALRVLQPLGVLPARQPAEDAGTDVGPAVEAGVPAFLLRQDGTRYFDIHHTADDTLDKIDRAAARAERRRLGGARVAGGRQRSRFSRPRRAARRALTPKCAAEARCAKSPPVALLVPAAASSPPMSEQLRVSVEGGVCEVCFDRPEKRNAITFAMYEALARALHDALGDEAVRAVLLRGEGAGFCAGNDLQDFLSGPEFTPQHPVMEVLRTLATFDKPLLAAVHGQAVGIGVTMLLHCDLVVAATQRAVLAALRRARAGAGGGQLAAAAAPHWPPARRGAAVPRQAARCRRRRAARARDARGGGEALCSRQPAASPARSPRSRARRSRPHGGCCAAIRPRCSRASRRRRACSACSCARRNSRAGIRAFLARGRAG